jgi:hypothetical protein
LGVVFGNPCQYDLGGIFGNPCDKVRVDSLAILANDFGGHWGMARFAKANLAGFTFVKP